VQRARARSIPGWDSLVQKAADWVSGEVTKGWATFTQSVEDGVKTSLNPTKTTVETALTAAQKSAQTTAQSAIDTARTSITTFQTKIASVESDAIADLTKAQTDLATLQTTMGDVFKALAAAFKNPFSLSPDADCTQPAFFADIDTFLDASVGVKPLVANRVHWCRFLKIADGMKMRPVVDKLVGTKSALFKSSPPSFLEMGDQVDMRALAASVNWNVYHSFVEVFDGIVDLITTTLAFFDTPDAPEAAGAAAGAVAGGAPTGGAGAVPGAAAGSAVAMSADAQMWAAVVGMVFKLVSTIMRSVAQFQGCPN